MSIRTDLALEARELWQESAGKQTQLPGVRARERLREGCPVTRVRILDRRGEQALGKPRGTYVTLDLRSLRRQEPDSFSRACRAVAGELSFLLPPGDGEVLVVGLGNRAITPDALGPLTVEHTLVTRHLVEALPAAFGSFRPVAAIAAGVLGSTGLESSELLAGLVKELQPRLVLAVDALASRRVERLCSTVQLTDTGIVPGSGVGNHRLALDQNSLGVPVIAIGVPTVVEAGTLAADLRPDPEQKGEHPALSAFGGQLMVTPKEIDAWVGELARVLGCGIGLALQPGLDVEDLLGLLGK